MKDIQSAGKLNVKKWIEFLIYIYIFIKIQKTKTIQYVRKMNVQKIIKNNINVVMWACVQKQKVQVTRNQTSNSLSLLFLVLYKRVKLPP